jgi:NUMOD3 motif
MSALTPEERQQRAANAAQALWDKMTPEQRQEHGLRMAAVHRGVPKTAEHRQKISTSNKGKPKSPEHLAKLSAARKGKRYPNLSAAKKAQPPGVCRHCGLEMRGGAGPLAKHERVCPGRAVLVELAAAGLTVRQIAEQVGRDYEAVRLLLGRLGIETVRAKGAKR